MPVRQVPDSCRKSERITVAVSKLDFTLAHRLAKKLGMGVSQLFETRSLRTVRREARRLRAKAERPVTQ